jgi:hypothetical protein
MNKEKLYLICDYDLLDWTLDLSKDLDIANELFDCWSRWYKETHLLELIFDKSKYNFEREYYKFVIKDKKWNEINENDFEKKWIIKKELLYI